MGQLSVKSPNISFRDIGNVKGTDKAADKNKDVSDAFRSLLKEKPEESKETIRDEKEGLLGTEQEQPSGTDKEETDVHAELLGAVFLMSQMGQNIQTEESAGAMTEESLAILGETAENAQVLTGAAEENAFSGENVAGTEKNAQTGVFEAGESVGTEQAAAAEMQTAPVSEESAGYATLKETPKADGLEGKKETAFVKSNQADDKAEEKGLAAGAVSNHTVQNTGAASGTKSVVPTQPLHVSRPQEIGQKLPDMLFTKISEGRQEFEIQIEPANLGRIAIKVLHEAGQTVVSIACSERRTLELIGQNAREIGNMMERNLGNETVVYVEKKDSDYQNEYGEDHSGRESEQERQKEENKKQKTSDGAQFLQRLRLGLIN